MSARRFLHSYATVPSLILFAIASATTIALREARAPFIHVLGCFALLAVISATCFLRTVLAWQRARRQGRPLPRKLTVVAMFVAALAAWGAGLGGVLLSFDRPPYLDALSEATYQIRQLVQAREDIKHAQNPEQLSEAKSEFEWTCRNCKSALDKLRLTAPCYRLACLIFVIGFISSLVSAVLVPLTCWRRVSVIQVAQLAT
jgi:hypothetical protein